MVDQLSSNVEEHSIDLLSIARSSSDQKIPALQICFSSSQLPVLDKFISVLALVSSLWSFSDIGMLSHCRLPVSSMSLFYVSETLSLSSLPASPDIGTQ